MNVWKYNVVTVQGIQGLVKGNEKCSSHYIWFRSTIAACLDMPACQVSSSDSVHWRAWESGEELSNYYYANSGPYH